MVLLVWSDEPRCFNVMERQIKLTALHLQSKMLYLKLVLWCFHSNRGLRIHTSKAIKPS